MAIPVIAPTTAAIATQVTFNTHGLAETVAFSASGLAGTEKITPWMGGSNGWTAMWENGTQVFLTVDAPQISVIPGAHYGFTKDATAGAVGLDAIITK